MSLDIRRVSRVGDYVTAPWRVLPSALIIGAQRGGTTSLHNYLLDHPDVHGARRKEVHYFDRHHRKGQWWYRGQFPTRRVVGRSGMTIDATPYLLFHPLAARRAAAQLPQARFVAVLRDPVERAHSHWAHNLQRGIGPDSFEEALEREAGLVDVLTEQLRSGKIKDSREHQRYSFVRRGEYIDQLATWWSLVGRDRVLVLASEALYADPAEVLARTYSFLGLRPHAPESGYPLLHQADRPGMRDETRKALKAHFQPFNERLFRELGQTFPWQ
jgi:hypothetical protein